MTATLTATINRPHVQGRLFDVGQYARSILSSEQPWNTIPGIDGHEVTWADYYCGAGGSSSGIHLVAGAKVVMAANHWDLAVATHNYNFPNTDHDQADITGIDPRRHPKTDFAWFSPECTTWSGAAGEPCDYDGVTGDVIDGYLDNDDDRPLSEQAKVRSRVQMLDVVRFSAYHHYRGVIVENVPDILKWKNLGRWLADMVKLGYRYKVLTLNSAFAQGLGAPSPQLRDRVYFVFWKAQYRTPNWDKWLRPYAWCPSCQQVVRAIYTPKPGPRRPMRYGKGAQYFYRCPTKCKADMVQPFVMPAQSVIDLTKPTVRIRDRKRPLAANTYARIGAGLNRYGRRRVELGVPMLVPTGGTWNDTATFGDQPMRTRTTRENEAVVGMPAMTISTSGRDGSGRPRQIGEPFATQTGRHEAALVQAPLYVPLRNNGVARPATEAPLQTFAAGGTHHALVMRNNGGGAEMTTPMDEPVRTLTTAGHQSVIGVDSGPAMVMRHKTSRGGESRCTPMSEPVRTLTATGSGCAQSVVGFDDAAIYSYDSGALRPLATDPLPTQTTIEGDAVFGPAPDIEDCTLRMLDVDEVQGGMSFSPQFVLLGDAKRDKIKMLGNAVTPPSSRDLAACLMEAVLGIEYPMFEFALAA